MLSTYGVYVSPGRERINQHALASLTVKHIVLFISQNLAITGEKYLHSMLVRYFGITWVNHSAFYAEHDQQHIDRVSGNKTDSK